MKMKAPEGATGCSFDGVEYEVVDGEVTVPSEAAGALMSHGYEVITAAATPADEAVESAVASRRKKATPADEAPAE